MRKLKVGDRVECIGMLRNLGLNPGDVGIVLATFENLDASVHFDKWDRGDCNWSGGAGQHNVRGQSAFYIDVNDLELIQTCMFSKGGDAV